MTPDDRRSNPEEPTELGSGAFAVAAAAADDLMAGAIPASDPEWGQVAQLFDDLQHAAASSALGGDAWMRQQVTAAATAARDAAVVPQPTSGHGHRRLRIAAAVAVATIAGTIGLAGLAAADTLPRPVQTAVSRAVAFVGIHVPSGSADGDDHDRGPGRAPGSTVLPTAPPDPASDDRREVRSDAPATSPVPPAPVDAGAGTDERRKQDERDDERRTPATPAPSTDDRNDQRPPRSDDESDGESGRGSDGSKDDTDNANDARKDDDNAVKGDKKVDKDAEKVDKGEKDKGEKDKSKGSGEVDRSSRSGMSEGGPR